MSQVDYTAKAKALAKRAVQSGLVILPLACALNMQAASALPTTNPTCSATDLTSGDSPACTTGAIATGPVNGVSGVKLYISGGSNTVRVSGSYGISNTPNRDVLMLGTSGSVSPTWSPASIPVSWAFTLTSEVVNGSFSSGTLTDYELVLNLSGYATGFYDTGIVPLPTNPTSLTVQGSNAITPIVYNPANANETVEAQLTVDWDVAFGSGNPFLDFTVPASSFDFNVASSSAPEPRGAGLLAAGLGMLGWVARRLTWRRKS